MGFQCQACDDPDLPTELTPGGEYLCMLCKEKARQEHQRILSNVAAKLQVIRQMQPIADENRKLRIALREIRDCRALDPAAAMRTIAEKTLKELDEIRNGEAS